MRQGDPADGVGKPCDVIVQDPDNEIDTFGDHVGVLNDYHTGVAVNVVAIRQDDKRAKEITLG